jgi:hypothetical protein
MTYRLIDQLSQDLQQAVINYLQVAVIKNENQPWEYIYKGVKYQCNYCDFEYVLGGMLYDNFISSEAFLACSSLLLDDSNIWTESEQERKRCLELALKIMPKYIRENLSLALTFYKQHSDKTNDNFASFIDKQIYPELRITHWVYSELKGFVQLMLFSEISNDETVDDAIKLLSLVSP